MKGIAVAYIPYRKTMQILQNSFNATPEELAVWIFAGKKNGGIDAYANANELDPPPRFYFNTLQQDATGTGYLSEIKAAWFDEDEVAKLHDQERYITAPVLVERWREMLGEDPEGDILAKISESQLSPIHPVTGLTQWEGGDVAGLAPRDAALFAFSEILNIEREDFGIQVSSEKNAAKTTSIAPVGYDSDISSQAVVTKNTQGVRKTKTPKAFTIALHKMLDAFIEYSKENGKGISKSELPGTKKQLQEVAIKYDEAMDGLKPRTFSDYLKGECTFTKGRRGASEENPFKKFTEHLFS